VQCAHNVPGQYSSRQQWSLLSTIITVTERKEKKKKWTTMAMWLQQVRKKKSVQWTSFLNKWKQLLATWQGLCLDQVPSEIFSTCLSQVNGKLIQIVGGECSCYETATLPRCTKASTRTGKKKQDKQWKTPGFSRITTFKFVADQPTFMGFHQNNHFLGNSGNH
jgi:hypothetical protein